MGVYPPGWLDRFVEVALERGATEVGFTEHLYRCVEAGPVLGRWWETDPDAGLRAEMAAWIASERNLSLEAYVEVVLDAKARGLPVKLGLEVDYVPGTESAVHDLLDGIPFDYILGSVHWIDGWNFMRDGAASEYARRGVRRAFEQYFELEAALPPEGAPDELSNAVVDAAATSGVAIEISSVGLWHTVGELYPSPALLSRFRAAGTGITLASDAHMPADAARGRDHVIEAARAAGYDAYLRFDARRPISTPLPAPSEPATDPASATRARSAPE
jgi:histidinol-phosphatase (PHP family)